MNRNNSRQQSRKKKPFTITLTKQQLTAISAILPKGYSFSFHAKLPPPNQLLKKNQRTQSYVKVLTVRQPEIEKPIQLKPVAHEKDQQQKQIEKPQQQKYHQCFEILKKIRSHPNHSVVLNLVSSKNNFYPESVKRKIKQASLQNIEKKCKKSSYRDPSQFYRDINRMFLTAYTKYKRKNYQYGVVEDLEIQTLIYAKQNIKQPQLQEDQAQEKQNEQATPVKQKIVSFVQPSFATETQNDLNLLIKRMSEVHNNLRDQNKRKNTKKTKRETSSFNISERKFLAQRCRTMQGSDLRNLAIIISQQRSPPNQICVDFQKIENKILKKVKVYVRQYHKVPQLQGFTDKMSIKQQQAAISSQNEQNQYQIQGD